MVAGLGSAGMLGGLGGVSATQGLGGSFMPGEWDWMQNPMMMQAMLGAGGMFGDQQQQPMMAPPQLGPMPMGRQTPIQAPQMPQTPFQQRPPWYGGMFSG